MSYDHSLYVDPRSVWGDDHVRTQLCGDSSSQDIGKVHWTTGVNIRTRAEDSYRFSTYTWAKDLSNCGGIPQRLFTTSGEAGIAVRHQKRRN